MNEQLKKYAKRYSETDLEILLCGAGEMAIKTAANIAIYENKLAAEDAHKKIAGADFMQAVLNAVTEEGFIAEIEGEHFVIAQAQKFEEKMSNKIWAANRVGPELAKLAQKGEVKIERVPSKYAKPAEELGWGTPGYTYCSVWRIPATHTIEIGGYVIPAYMVGYTQKITPRQTQWGTTEPDNKQLVPDKVKLSKLESVNRIIEAYYKEADEPKSPSPKKKIFPENAKRQDDKITVPYLFFDNKWREDLKYFTDEEFEKEFGYKFGEKKEAKLVEKVNPKTEKKEWALVSKDDSSKTLKYFGPKKPSDETVNKEEKRVQYFKHKAEIENPHRDERMEYAFQEYEIPMNDGRSALIDGVAEAKWAHGTIGDPDVPNGTEAVESMDAFVIKINKMVVVDDKYNVLEEIADVNTVEDLQKYCSAESIKEFEEHAQNSLKIIEAAE